MKKKGILATAILFMSILLAVGYFWLRISSREIERGSPRHLNAIASVVLDIEPEFNSDKYYPLKESIETGKTRNVYFRPHEIRQNASIFIIETETAKWMNNEFDLETYVEKHHQLTTEPIRLYFLTEELFTAEPPDFRDSKYSSITGLYVFDNGAMYAEYEIPKPNPLKEEDLIIATEEIRSFFQKFDQEMKDSALYLD